ncbi:MAG: hypothetical protein L3J43_06360 [Sulfurovum sp.]|nr:hypothetical protein [Sulfurovum sp.]
MNKELQEKLEKVVELVNNAMVDPNVDIEYCIPELTITKATRNASVDPYILLQYVVNETHTQNQKIPIKKNYLKKSPEDIANLVTFYIEQFIEQIESVEYGAQ